MIQRRQFPFAACVGLLAALSAGGCDSLDDLKPILVPRDDQVVQYEVYGGMRCYAVVREYRNADGDEVARQCVSEATLEQICERSRGCEKKRNTGRQP